MALIKSVQAAVPSATNAASATTAGPAFPVNYGVSGVATVTNGAVAPSVACNVAVQVSADGTTWFELSRQVAGLNASAPYTFPFALGVCGQGGDWSSYRIVFDSNDVAVTVAATAETTTAL